MPAAFKEQIFHASEILVESAFPDARTGDDIIDICGLITLFPKKLESGFDDSRALACIKRTGLKTGRNVA